MQPIPPGPNRHQSGEPASDPVSLTVPCSSLVHDLTMTCKSTASERRRERALASRQRGSGERRTVGEWIYCMQREECHCNSAPVCACRNTSVSRRDTVSERVSEQRTKDGGGVWRMLCELCCSFNQCWASVQRELACASVSLSHFLTRLSATMFISKFFPIFILFISTFA